MTALTVYKGRKRENQINFLFCSPRRSRRSPPQIPIYIGNAHFIACACGACSPNYLRVKKQATATESSIFRAWHAGLACWSGCDHLWKLRLSTVELSTPPPPKEEEQEDEEWCIPKNVNVGGGVALSRVQILGQQNQNRKQITI